jgi:hypothetical protein
MQKGKDQCHIRIFLGCGNNYKTNKENIIHSGHLIG